jgi:hypothetical protein
MPELICHCTRFSEPNSLPVGAHGATAGNGNITRESAVGLSQALPELLAIAEAFACRHSGRIRSCSVSFIKYLLKQLSMHTLMTQCNQRALLGIHGYQLRIFR